ncbi:MAG: hypothetical protein ACK452_03915, partial [Bacteroidota bacterium]
MNKIYVSTFGRGIWAADLNMFVNSNLNLISTEEIKLFPSVNFGKFSIEIPECKNLFNSTALEFINIK